MNNATLISSFLAACTLASTVSFADQRPMPRHDISKTITRETAAGTMTRTMEQRRTENGFTRQQTLTTPDGRTATRDMSVVNDRENQTRTREMTGTRLNGDTYSGQQVTVRTENGYQQTGTRTNANGETATRQVDATVDQEAQTLTKNISVTGFDGETKTKTVVIQKPVDTVDDGQ